MTIGRKMYISADVTFFEDLSFFDCSSSARPFPSLESSSSLPLPCLVCNDLHVSPPVSSPPVSPADHPLQVYSRRQKQPTEDQDPPVESFSSESARLPIDVSHLPIALWKGYLVPDILVAAIIGVVTGWCVGPVLPIVGHWLARSRVVLFLLQLSVLAMAVASQFFPYSEAAPKRVVLQHTFFTTGENALQGSNYDVSVVDPNSLAFLFEYSPDAAKELQINSVSLKTASYSDPSSWIALFPVPFLFTGSLKFPTVGEDILEHYRSFPHLYSYMPSTISTSGFRKIYLNLNLGSLEEVWVAVINITGPLSNWSFAGNKLPAPEVAKGAPSSYICRLSGRSYDNWTFWLEANSSESLRVDVAVLDQYLVDASKKLIGLFPSWVDVTAYSSFFSSYLF